MENQRDMEQISEVLHMNKGSGDTSYARNSSIQSKIISIAKPVMEEAIMELPVTTFPGESMGIADLGCSSGPNSLSAISNIIDVICARLSLLGRTFPAELRMYLNDLPSSDFNSVFGLLPEFLSKLKLEKGVEIGQCFVMGVPGSFYGRLFPRGTLHFVHTSSSLHWLSQVPAGLLSEADKPMNKGKLYVSKTSPRCVLDAYLLQFQKDFSLFLRSRSAEIVPGGGMVISLMGRRSTQPPTHDDCCYQWELLAESLMTLVLEGSIEEEKVDTFNAPYYAPSPEELRSEIEKEGTFEIKRLDAFEVEWDEGGGRGDDDECDEKLQGVRRGEQVARIIRAVTESMFEHHFGRDIMDKLFQRFGVLVNLHMSKARAKYINLAISLARKP